MNINILQIYKQMNKRKEQRLYEIKPIGSAIKFRRLEMQMTLEEAAEGICSVSYLSKLENNRIVPSRQFIEPLIDRFNLTDTFDIDYEKYVSHLFIIIDSMITPTNDLSNIALQYGTRKDYQAFLIRFCINTLNNDYEKAIDNYKDLRHSIPNLTNEELALFFICVSDLLYSSQQYSDACKVLLCAPSNEKIDSRLDLLIMRNKLLNAFMMHKVADILGLYPDYVNKLIDLQHYHLLRDISKKYLLFQSMYEEPGVIGKHLRKLKNVSKEDISYAMAYTYFNHQRYDDVIKYTGGFYKNCSRFLLLHMISLDYLKQKDKIKDLLEETTKMTNLCQTSKIVITHLKHKYSGDKTQLLNYLRREILGIKALTDEYQVLDYMMYDSQHIFSEYQHYKEAVAVIKKFSPKLKMLKRAEQIHINED